MSNETNRLATIAARQTKSRLRDRAFGLTILFVSLFTAASIVA